MQQKKTQNTFITLGIDSHREKGKYRKELTVTNHMRKHECER